MKIDRMLLLLASLLSAAYSSNSSSTTPTPTATAAVPLPARTVAPAAAVCERAPAHAQPSDGIYRISVAGEPDLFLPGELYTVSLQGVDNGQGPNPFTGFSIWVELSREAQIDKEESKTAKSTNEILGNFHAYDAQAKFNDDCTPAVVNATRHPKTDVQVIWSAPSMTAGECIRFCARAGPTVNVRFSVLARKICAAPTAPASIVKQPVIVEPCCACDEAKYEVTFEGLWSRNTHPREFPPESARAHFGDVIGASHTNQHRVWQEGRAATPGLRRLADDGNTTALEKELKAKSSHIRTIIKARGISWQQVAGAGIPSTFAVFRVDSKNHLVSLASKIAPSPDWIVGVSALELCAPNCTWTKSLTLPLFPYDAGTDSGFKYTSRRVPTIPAAPVRALRPNWPRDVRSPFFSAMGEIRPFARLRLTRLRLYEKICGPGEYRGDQPHLIAGIDGACATRGWSAWGPCSVSCGPGYRMRQRDYLYPIHIVAGHCLAELTQREACYGMRRHCRAPSEYEPDPAESHGPCALTEWSEWSPCEGCGVRARTRHYVVPRAMKRCNVGYRASAMLDQAMPCPEGPCEPVPPRYENFTNFDWFFIDTPISPYCRVSPWSSWSPCSADCGRGRRLRSRVYIVGDSRVQNHIEKTVHAALTKRFMELQNIDTPVVNLTVSPEVERITSKVIEECQFTLTMQETLCDGDDGSCDNSIVPLEVCQLPMLVGHCRDYYERWFFDYSRGNCEPFGFSGCGGNANNFRDLALCERNCLNRNDTATEQATTLEPVLNETMAVTKRLKPTPSHQANEVMVNDAPAFEEDVDCQTGPWLGWSDCRGDCEYAHKVNYRIVVRPSSGQGKPCRRLMKTRVCKPEYCRHILTASSATTTPSPDEPDELIETNNWLLEN